MTRRRRIRKGYGLGIRDKGINTVHVNNRARVMRWPSPRTLRSR